MTIKKKDNTQLDYYLNLPWSYNIETTKENDEFLYIVCVNELPGICTDAPTIPKAMSMIKQAMKASFELYLENGETIPDPFSEESSGNIVYRTSMKRRSLLLQEAQKRNLSLSNIIDDCIDNFLKR